jgi:hypothetical protein
LARHLLLVALQYNTIPNPLIKRSPSSEIALFVITAHLSHFPRGHQLSSPSSERTRPAQASRFLLLAVQTSRLRTGPIPSLFAAILISLLRLGLALSIPPAPNLRSRVFDRIAHPSRIFFQIRTLHPFQLVVVIIGFRQTSVYPDNSTHCARTTAAADTRRGFRH